MKKILTLFLIIVSGLLISAFNSHKSTGNTEKVEIKSGITIPDDIKGILDNSCWGCHNSESKNTKAKAKMKFDKLNDLKVSKQVSKLNKIVKEIEKGDMPPEKTLEKYPDMALSADSQIQLIEWAKNSSDELMK
jgi:exonuclease VII small subunit